MIPTIFSTGTIVDSCNVLNRIVRLVLIRHDMRVVRTGWRIAFWSSHSLN